jgi:hypothetical protein
MHQYRVIVHYHFKNGMEKEAIRFLEEELLKIAKECKCHDIEVWYNEKNPMHTIGMALWDNLEDARKFQAKWEFKEKELMKYCSAPFHKEIFKVSSDFAKRFGKAA